MQAIEKESSRRRPIATAQRPTPGRQAPLSAFALLAALLCCKRMLVGSWVLVTINTLIFGFVIFLPQFFLRQGLTITQIFSATRLVLARRVNRGMCDRWHSRLISIGRRWSIIGASIVTIVSGWIYARFNAASDPTIVLSIGFVLIAANLCSERRSCSASTRLELFPTEVRLRG